MKKFNISVSPLESTTCLATIHPYLANLAYINFPLAPKRTESWSLMFQKNRKYKVTTTVTNEEIQHFSAPLESTTFLAIIHSYLTNLVHTPFFWPKSEFNPGHESFRKTGNIK